MQPKDLYTGEWVIAVNNRPYFGMTYLFALLIKGFQFVFVSRQYAGFQHAARIKDGRVIEMLGNGRHAPAIQEWLSHRNRTVAVFKADKPFVWLPSMPYGYFDILQIAFSRIRAWLGIGREWNGKDGVPKKYIGFFCSEEIALASQRSEQEAANLLPAQLFEKEWLEYKFTFETEKA